MINQNRKLISLPQAEEEHGHPPPPAAAANPHSCVHPQTPSCLCSDTSTHGQRFPLCITTVEKKRNISKQSRVYESVIRSR